jgi:signal transduction histidine kinase
VDKSKKVEQLLYQQELFRARLELREHFLKSFSREIYENIAQVLSLVKFQLSLPEPEKNKDAQGKTVHLGNLLGQAIKDLRNLSRGFYTDILTEYGLINSLQSEIRLLEKTGKKIAFKITGSITETSVENELILFGIIKEIFNRIGDAKGARLISVETIFRRRQSVFIISYTGNGIQWQVVEEKKSGRAYPESLTIFQKAAFVNARIDIKAVPQKKTSIKLTVPTK